MEVRHARCIGQLQSVLSLQSPNADETQHRAQERHTRALDTGVAAAERDQSSGGPPVIMLDKCVCTIRVHMRRPTPSAADAGHTTPHDARRTTREAREERRARSG
ncbi:unnamed protein product [Triticum turgidum subsp. durum]|uniref:Uncharacterized protein n=1 Tax=Triticum turgidum subsp. durum TaxID=4567 RepID=A0A9R0RH96_TRITD|nr:unnamed protein product [Triticum turgidum subsp. durum]